MMKGCLPDIARWGHGTKLLGDGDTQDQQNHDERDGPKNVDPSSAYADAWNHTGLKLQPSTHASTIIHGFQTFFEEIVLSSSMHPASRVDRRHAVALGRSCLRLAGHLYNRSLVSFACGGHVEAPGPRSFRSRLPWAKGMDVKPGLGHHDGERNVVVCENTSRLGIYSGQSEQT